MSAINNPRIYGFPPYRVAVVHGGPGAAGGMADVAERLSAFTGVLEPFQTRLSIEGEITELNELITGAACPPVILIGHSWGAWLSLLTAARYPESVSKLILVASAPLEESYAGAIHETRMKRLSRYERMEFHELMKNLSSPDYVDHSSLSQPLHELLLKSDCYRPLEAARSYWKGIRLDAKIFSRIWEEAAGLRSSGEMLRASSSVVCPVVAIHGDYDPHPAVGVELPLKRFINDFRFISLKKCGHYPWMEKHASEKFYDILKTELL